MTLLLILVLWMFTASLTNGGYTFVEIIPFGNDSTCTQNSVQGIGYSFISGVGCIPGISQTNPLQSSGDGILQTDYGLTMNVFGEIASFEFFSSNNCTKDTLVSSTAYKNKGCYLVELQSIKQWSKIQVTDLNNSPPLPTSSIGLISTQYQSIGQCQQQPSKMYQYYYYITNNTILYNQENNGEEYTYSFYCSNNTPFQSICLNDSNHNSGSQECKDIDIELGCTSIPYSSSFISQSC